MARSPQAIAVTCDGLKLTYAQLDKQASNLAHELRQRCEGTRLVAVLLEPSIDIPVALLGILKAGFGYLALDPSWPDLRLYDVLTESQVACVVTTTSLGSRLTSECFQLLYVNSLPLDLDQILSSVNSFDSWSKPEDIAYVLYTTGTTGKPKGVMISHRAIVNRLYGMQDVYRLRQDDVILQKTSLGFDVSVWEVFWPLMIGASIVIPSSGVYRDVAGLIELILLHHVTTLHFVPGMLDLFLQHPNATQCGSIRRIFCGGELLTPRLQQLFFRLLDAELHHLYGPTEATIDVTAWACQRHGQHEFVPIGKPVQNVSIYLLGEDGSPVPRGEVGEICIAGCQLALGYLNQPELTADRFKSHTLIDGTSIRIYCTGDFARMSPDGCIAYLGRSDQQLKLRGVRVELGEIEAVIIRHPGIRQCVVVPHGEGPSTALVAYLTTDEVTFNTSPLLSSLHRSLPAVMVPASFVILEKLPLTVNQKVDRKALQKNELRPSFHSGQSSKLDSLLPLPATLEDELKNLWQIVLGRHVSSLSEDFFLNGGDSLLANILILKVLSVFGVTLSLREFFVGPTIAAQALKIRSKLLPVVPGLGKANDPALNLIPRVRSVEGDWPEGCVAYFSSFAQERMWLLHRLHPECSPYNLSFARQLYGDLDVNALRDALTQLVERHPSLRSSFHLRDGVLMQCIHPPETINIILDDICNSQSYEANINAWLDQGLTFDLASSKLLVARLLRIRNDNYLVQICIHHIVADGWSCSVLARDLTELYNASHVGRPASLEPLSVQYHDYAAWQRQYLSGDRLIELIEYWRMQLKNLESLDLPADRPRPVKPSFSGQSVCFQIASIQLASFEELCGSEGATLQMGLLTLVAILLHRISRQGDFAIGIPFWGRNHPELENLIGLFVNTLPIRTRYAPGMSFLELLALMRETSIEAYDKQALPFEQIVEVLNVERDMSRNPLVQVMLQLIELPEVSLEQLDGLRVKWLPSSRESAKFDLVFEFSRTEDNALLGCITYASDLYDSDRIERMASHLLSLLSSVLQAPNNPVDSLHLLPESELQLVQSWQHGPDIDVSELGVHELFEQQVKRTPEAIALEFADLQLTYRELNARSNQLAHHLIDLGVGPEVLVGVSLERSVELVVSLLAILKAGGAYLPLDSAWPEERKRMLVDQAGCALLLTSSGPVVIHQIITSCRFVSSPPLAYVSYTSGSTGVPKGVAVGHAAILRLVHPVNGFLLGEGQRVLQLAPVAFDAATLEIWGPLLNGGTLVIAPPGQLTLQELAGVLRQERISTLWLTAGLFHAMVENELAALSGVRQVMAGGDVLSPAHVQRLLEAFPPGHGLVNGYGPTEATTFTSCHRLAAGERVDGAGVPIGRPIAKTSVLVLEPCGQPCPIGVPGELHIGGAGLARGYLNNPELTAETFIADPFSTDPTARLYKSGDLVSWNSDGTLAFHGRIDQQIKLRGFRIEPGEIEANLLAHPAVVQAVALLRHDDPSNPRLIAYWVADASHETTAAASSEQLRAFLADRLPDYMVPAAFLQLEALPLTPNGKLDRKALPAPSFSGNLDQRVDPCSDLERQLHGIWAEVLGHSEFGVSDNFFLVGGHSLSSARLSALIERQLGRRLPLSVLFQRPTLRELSAWLESGDRPAADTPASVSGFRSLVTLQHHGEAPPLFVVHGGHGDVYIHLHLARCLAPHRPVHGLQAVGFDGSAPRQRSVAEMAVHYADEILRFQPSGPYHLLGYSGGGWYAWAVAAELHRRGATMGLIGLVDTGSTADLHRRLRLRQLVRRQLHHLPRRARSLAATDFSRWPAALNRKRQALQFIAWTLLRPQGTPAPQALNPAATPRPTHPLRGDYFLQLHTYFRPPRLPLRTDVFASRLQINHLRKLWNFYAQGGAILHPCLEDHTDYYNAEWMAEFALYLTDVLARIEACSPREMGLPPSRFL